MTSPMATTTEGASPSLLSPDLLRIAAAYAREHEHPLLCRLNGAEGGPVVCAGDRGDDIYRMYASAVMACVPRRVLLDYTGEELDGFAAEHGGPPHPSDEEIAEEPELLAAWEQELEEWLDDEMDVSDAFNDSESLDAFMRGVDPGYLAFERVLGLCETHMQWHHPDTGELLGEFGHADSMWADLTLFAEGHAALTCLQWTADLAGIPLQVSLEPE